VTPLEPAPDPDITLPPGVIGYAVARLDVKPQLTHCDAMPRAAAERELDLWRHSAAGKQGPRFTLVEIREAPWPA
jgi:hypothetical protein